MQRRSFLLSLISLPAALVACGGRKPARAPDPMPYAWEPLHPEWCPKCILSMEYHPNRVAFVCHKCGLERSKYEPWRADRALLHHAGESELRTDSDIFVNGSLDEVAELYRSKMPARREG